MEPVAIVIGLALIQFFWFGYLVGSKRGPYEVPAPAIAGHPIFERYMRVQQNTMEQLVIFVPAMWMFGMYVDPRIAAGLGLVYLAGRFVYLRLYVQEPDKRGPGVLLTLFAQAILMLGGTIGAAVAWLG